MFEQVFKKNNQLVVLKRKLPDPLQLLDLNVQSPLIVAAATYIL